MDGSRILVIDDSTTLGKLVEIAMRGTGCRVDFAATGSDGVSRARTSQPDVILLDYLLPDLRSAEVCQRLRDDTATSGVPVVIMSANEPDVLDDFRAFSSVVGFIGKPFTAEEIRARLRGVVRRGKLADPARPAALASASSADAGDGLLLRGDLAATPIVDVLRLLAASHATGALMLSIGAPGDSPGASRIWLRRGEIVMCVDASADAGALGELTLAHRERVTRNLLLGKPAQVTLAELGPARAPHLPLELHAASVRLLGDWLGARSGRFAWEPAASLPDFVEAFGRPVSLTAVTLEHARRAGSAARLVGELDHVYDRSPKFSDKLAGARLGADEQRLLALIDGQSTGRQVIQRARLAADDGAAILSRLCTAGLIRRDLATRRAAAPTLAVRDHSDDFVASLQDRLGRRSPPVEVVALDPARSLAAATLDAHPALLLIAAAALTREVVEHDLPIIARDTTIAVVCVLESPDPALAVRLLATGLHAVIAKPVHVTEIERLLSGSRSHTQEIPCPPFS